MGPDLGAVMGDEDRHIAEQTQTAPVGMGLEGQPLGKEQVLLEAEVGDLVRQSNPNLF